MNEQGSSGGVSYKQVGADYFANRGLKRYAKVWSLWALGVGAVISGHYSGWNFGLANGWGSMLVALFIIAAPVAVASAYMRFNSGRCCDSANAILFSAPASVEIRTATCVHSVIRKSRGLVPAASIGAWCWASARGTPARAGT